MNTKAIAAIAVVAVLLVGGVAAAFIVLSGSDDTLPAKYDQRDKGIVTSVKYQSPWGTCWSFGSTGAAETSVLTYLGKTVQQYKEEKGQDLDFSEKHLAWFALNAVTDAETDTQVGEGFMLLYESDYHYIYDNGGKASMAASLYSTGVGPVLEKDNFRYMGANGITAADYFRGEDAAAGIANTKVYLDFFAKDQLDDTTYMHYLQDIEEYKLNNLLGIYRDWGVALDPSLNAAQIKADVDAGYNTLVTALRDYYITKYTESNEYSEMDSWPIALGAPSQRNLTAGYTMINGNSLPAPYKVKDSKWDGLSNARMELIKKELYAGRGMGMSYYYDANTLNKDTWAQFNTFADGEKSIGQTNHAIQVVGWDDSYSKDNFKERPERDGAWLCKNSWGSETDYKPGDIGYSKWGIKNEEGKHTGYFWLSYCDRSINRIISYEFGAAPDEYSFNTYVYDFLPSHREDTLQSDNVLKTANIFTIEDSKEILKSVSVKTAYMGSDVKVSVYKLNDGYKNPEDGTLLWSTSTNYQLEGFHRILVDKEVQMTQGQKIAVVVEEKNSHIVDGETTYIADYNYGYDDVRAKSDESKKAIYSVTKVNEGESFYLMDGVWHDWHDTWVKSIDDSHLMIDNFRIKMFTADAPA